jgi:uncharacterized protein with PIN domain
MHGENKMSNRLRQCGIKKRYCSEEIAQEYVDSSPVSNILNVYLCKYCHYWHVGHIKGATKLMVKRR